MMLVAKGWLLLTKTLTSGLKYFFSQSLFMVMAMMSKKILSSVVGSLHHCVTGKLKETIPL